MRYLTGVYWCRGRVAGHNQDSVVLLQALTAGGRVLMAAVCDGMSGLAQGGDGQRLCDRAASGVVL